MYDYRLIRSDRRTLALEITPDLQVVIRAPRRCSQREIARFAADHEGWVMTHLPIQQRRMEARAARAVTPEQERELRRQAAEDIPRRVARWAPLVGVTPASVKITGAQKRFGSCSSKGGLCFSWRLMQYPDEAIDYVVVHELCHLLHHDHSPRFWAAVAAVMPDYKQRQKLLKD